MRVLVTGAVGFIGSHVCKKFLSEGHEVVGIDNLAANNKSYELTKKDLKHSGLTDLKVIDFTDCDAVFDLFFKHEGSSQFDAIIHLGALPRVQFSIEHTLESNKANIDGTLNLLYCANEFGIQRFVYSSSSSVYGNQDTLPLKEDMKPNPLSPYALQKLVGEYYCDIYHNVHGMETISLRYFNVYGPWQRPDSSYAALIPKFAHCMIKNEGDPVIFGDGLKSRDFTFVEDVAMANYLAATTDNEKAYGQVFNIGGGKNHTVNQVVSHIREFTETTLQHRHGPPVVESEHTLADISKSKELLGWEPTIDFKEGLRITIESMKEELGE